MSLFDLSGKVAVVTGGFRGIGKTLALGLQEYGAKTVAVDILCEQDEEIRDGILSLRCDITRKDQIDKTVALVVNRFGKIDILVNNAALVRSCPALDMSQEDWEEMIRVNVTGTFLFSQAVGREMAKQKKGKVITIASNQSEAGVENFSAYGTSKGAVWALTRTLAVEWARYGINVNAISPAATWSPATEKKFQDQEILRRYIADIPIGRVLVPSDLLGALIYLASNASDMVTGHNLHVDGGYLAK
jgi:2-dehydro-3-deoxy-D-gluconate 5-dehydrogenase